MDDPDLGRGGDHRIFIEDVVLYASRPPYHLETIAAERPEDISRLLRVVLDDPDFQWSSDGEALLKARYATYKEKMLPSILPLSQELAKGLAWLKENDREKRAAHTRKRPSKRKRSRTKRRR